ncbi:hypothetical protein LIS66_27110 (plasmid) [Pseudomonas sp. HN2]|uniref:hypothetical protein n=1 Tax=Pseudomonas sp. HN2 TaxID=2884805 RepID=UPI001D1527FE|nr:hypothetical protein [Pseudomonas sp. HN2]UEB98644.1 hypothetical protein LIS66_27400 [Pseudomonas sp. HN2]UEB98701.1 hypothetical protein LIS66_27110 [Pseudomonas sp. HN2]
MAFSYVGPAVLRFIGADAIEREAAVNVTLGETMPGLFELSFPYDLAESLGASRVRVALPDGEVLGGAVGYLAASSLTFLRDRVGQA